jgi:hypothetical protein
MLPSRFLPLLLPLLVACTPIPQQPSVTLPETARDNGVTDPARSAILSTAYVFGQPASVAGDPASAAEALARLEYLTVELASGPRWIDLDPLVAPDLMRARAETRAAFGLDPAAPPQRAVNALFGTAAALRAGQPERAEAALATVTGPQRAPQTLRQLAALPNLPVTQVATARAQQALTRRDRDNNRGFRF